MSDLVGVGAGVVTVGVFAALACGRLARRFYRNRRIPDPNGKTRPTIPNLVALPRTRDW